MATSRNRNAKSRDNKGSNGGSEMVTGMNGDLVAPGTTGRYLVLLREGAVKSGVKAMKDAAGLRVATTADFSDGAVEGKQLAEAEAILFEDLGVAVVDSPPDQIQALTAAAAEENTILAIEPERVVYALSAAAPARIVDPEVAEGVSEFFTAPPPPELVAPPSVATG